MVSFREVFKRNDEQIERADDFFDPPQSVAEEAVPTEDGLHLVGVFEEFQDFKGRVFKGSVEVRDARFKKGFSFEGCVFMSPARFVGISNDRSGTVANFKDAKFFSSVSFQKSSLYRLDFRNVETHSFAKFKATKFYSLARFNGSRFKSQANFSKALFHGAGDFGKVRFEGVLDFAGTIFCYEHCGARFREAHFSQEANFSAAHFTGDADFSGSEFKKGAVFTNSRFCLRRQEVLENGDDEQGETDRPGDLVVSFEGALFDAEPGEPDVVSFENSKFGDITFPRIVSFERALFRTWQPGKTVCANFKRMNCFGTLKFGEAQFLDGVNVEFQHSRLEHDLDLEDCIFKGNMSLERAHIGGDLFLTSTRFGNFPDLRQAKLGHAPQIAEATFPEGTGPLTAATREQLLQRLRTLRKFASQADDKKTEHQLLVRELKIGGGVASWLYGLLANYGQSWLRPTLWMLALTLLFFPPIYLATSGHLPTRTNEFRMAIQNFGISCRGDPQESAIAVALDLSVKNALVVASENSTRDDRINGCLGTLGPSGHLGFAYTLLEAVQKIVTFIFVFFIGASIRRRLQMR